MNIILLSGGSGKRLWPLSNEVRAKQFIPIFPHKDGYESMVQRVAGQLKNAVPEASITIATSQAQRSVLCNQLGNDILLSLEPCRRDTFPAIALCCAMLHDVYGVNEKEIVVVCPVDPLVDESFFAAFKQLEQLVEQERASLVLMGIDPTYPSEKYGYIIPEDKYSDSRVLAFREKPDAKTAAGYIEQGALWNGGVFAFRLGYVLEKAAKLLSSADYDVLYQSYSELPKISFDYAVTEAESSIFVHRYCGQWRDLGTWNMLCEAMEDNCIGSAIIDEACENVHILNELDMPVLAMGLNNVVIAASPDGILVSEKERSAAMKPYVEKFENKVMFAEKSWGSYRILSAEADSLTIKVTLKPGTRMSYHAHERRDEIWNIISGTGRIIVDGIKQEVTPGDCVTIAATTRHTLIADTELKAIEVQLGRDISVSDKQIYELEE